MPGIIQPQGDMQGVEPAVESPATGAESTIDNFGGTASSGAQDVTPPKGQKGTVPYERFAEVNKKASEAVKRAEQLEAQNKEILAQFTELRNMFAGTQDRYAKAGSLLRGDPEQAPVETEWTDPLAPKVETIEKALEELRKERQAEKQRADAMRLQAVITKGLTAEGLDAQVFLPVVVSHLDQYWRKGQDISPADVIKALAQKLNGIIDRKVTEKTTPAARRMVRGDFSAALEGQPAPKSIQDADNMLLRALRGAK